MELSYVFFIFGIGILSEALLANFITGFNIFNGMIVFIIVLFFIIGLICFFKEKDNNFP